MAVDDSTAYTLTGAQVKDLVNRIKALEANQVTLTLSTTDIGEGAPLAANTLYGVYN